MQYNQMSLCTGKCTAFVSLKKTTRHRFLFNCAMCAHTKCDYFSFFPFFLPLSSHSFLFPLLLLVHVNCCKLLRFSLCSLFPLSSSSVTLTKYIGMSSLFQSNEFSSPLSLSPLLFLFSLFFSSLLFSPPCIH